MNLVDILGIIVLPTLYHNPSMVQDINEQYKKDIEYLTWERDSARSLAKSHYEEAVKQKKIARRLRNKFDYSEAENAKLYSRIEELEDELDYINGLNKPYYNRRNFI